MSEDPPIFPDSQPTVHGKFEGPATADDYEAALKIDPRQVAQLIFREHSATTALSEKESEKYDDVTGLLYGAYFRAEANGALRKLKPNEERRSIPNNALIVSLDGKGLKLFNDQHGHAAGDTMLHNIGAILKAAAARPEDIVARSGSGSDEFCAIFFFRDDLIDPVAMKEAIDERLLMLTKYSVERGDIAGLKWCSTFFEPGKDINYHLEKADPVEAVNPGNVIEFPSKDDLPSRSAA